MFPSPSATISATTRFDWAQSSKSQWFLRAAIDNYITHNALVQQGTLPSTGAEQHNNYMNMVISNTYAFSPTWLGSFVFTASGLHLTEARNSDLGYALAFPFTSTSQTISGFETYGDNQFLTPITAFPVLRNQEKYQFRYDVSGVVGKHAPRFGINFIHEPVLSGALSGTAETLLAYTNNPDFYAANPSQFYFDLNCANPPADVSCTATPAGNGSFSQNVQRLGLYAEDSWRITSHLTFNYGLRYDTTFGLLTASGRSSSRQSRVPHAQGSGDSSRQRRSPGLPQSLRAAAGHRVFSRPIRNHRDSRRLRTLLRRSRADRLGHRASGG